MGPAAQEVHVHADLPQEEHPLDGSPPYRAHICLSWRRQHKEVQTAAGETCLEWFDEAKLGVIYLTYTLDNIGCTSVDLKVTALWACYCVDCGGQPDVRAGPECLPSVYCQDCNVSTLFHS